MHALVEHIIDLATRLGNWGYLVVFLIVVLECQAVLGFFIPGESLVLITGFLAGQHVFELDAIIVAVAAGAIVGDSIGFELGRGLGRRWLQRHGSRVGIGPKRLRRAERFIERHGGKSVFAAHFMHILRSITPFLAGAHRMPYRKFIGFNAAGCILWSVVFVGAGYLLGESWELVEKWVGRVAVIVGIVVAIGLGLAWLWAWLARHEEELRARWAAFNRQPRVQAFRGRFARQIEFLENRLTPEGYLGLHLTIGAAIFVLAAWWFGGVVEDVVTREPLVTADHRMAAWFNQHATPELTHWAVVLTALGSYVVLYASLAVAAWFVLHRSWYRLATLVITVGGGTLLSKGVKLLFQRPRPELEHPLGVFSSFSFPSGHTTAATLFYGLMAVFVMQSIQRWRWRLLAPFVAVFLIQLVALTRLYLGAHFLSDVLGAMALGVMWLSFAVTAVELERRYREHHSRRRANSPAAAAPG